MSFFDKLKNGLSKTKNNLDEKINEAFSTFRKVDEDLLDELEEILIMSDIGIDTSSKLINNLRKKIKLEKIKEVDDVKKALRELMIDILDEQTKELKLNTKPSVILVIGVNGVGKTTSIGKIANRLKKENKSIVLAAADTFRAAAVEQLEIWAERSKCDIVKKQEGVDPASVVYDAIKITKEKNADILICDTAGRLHNKKYLMDELYKIQKVIDKELPEANKEVLLVIDATTGQNAISQVKAFKEVAPITGLVLTKLDGTAKGGVVLGIVHENKIPVKFIGVGEGIEDMEVFNSKDFVNAIISVEDHRFYESKKNKIKIVTVLIFAILIAIGMWMSYRATYLQTLEIGEEYLDVFYTNVNYKYKIMLVNFALFFIIFFVQNIIIKRGLKPFFKDDGKEMQNFLINQ